MEKRRKLKIVYTQVIFKLIEIIKSFCQFSFSSIPCPMCLDAMCRIPTKWLFFNSFCYNFVLSFVRLLHFELFLLPFVAVGEVSWCFEILSQAETRKNEEANRKFCAVNKANENAKITTRNYCTNEMKLFERLRIALQVLMSFVFALQIIIISSPI